MKIYSRTGDEGETGLVGGSRTSKTSARIWAIGALDEVNAGLGVVRGLATGGPLETPVSTIQNWLFDLGAELATPRESGMSNDAISQAHVDTLERWIDELTGSLPPLRAFILPGGTVLAGHLHEVRTTCRRAERTILILHEIDAQRGEVLAFVNRLSDWLFVAARTANALENVVDIEWRKSEGV